MTRPVVVVGESLVDLVVPLEGETMAAAGGSPMNVAVGLARLEVPTLLITQIGDDEHGRRVAEHVRSSGVELADSSIEPGRTTSTATARLDAAQVATYDFEVVWDLPVQRLPDDVAALHVGSLGASLLPGRLAVLDLVQQADSDEVFVSYDPNIRPAFVTDPTQAWHDVVELATSCRLVKLSEEDLHVLRPVVAEKDLAGELLGGSATEMVIVTHGADGATAYTHSFSVQVPGVSVDVVDTVGAGDSFMAATLAILHDWEITTDGPGALSALDEDHVRILLEGSITAAGTTCARRGANPPTRQELPTTWPAP